MWSSYEKHSKESEGEAQYMSYDGKYRNIVERTS